MRGGGTDLGRGSEHESRELTDPLLEGRPEWEECRYGPHLEEQGLKLKLSSSDPFTKERMSSDLSRVLKGSLMILFSFSMTPSSCSTYRSRISDVGTEVKAEK